MMRKVRNGVLGALATLATLYAFGVVGLLTERLTGRPELSTAAAFVGLVLALGVGFLVLHHLSRPADRPSPPTDQDPADTAEPGTPPDRGGISRC
jgi:hypothetical protein